MNRIQAVLQEGLAGVEFGLGAGQGDAGLGPVGDEADLGSGRRQGLALGPLDAELRGALLERLGRLHDELDLTVIHVTHDPQEASGIADREVRMRAGALLPS